MNYLVFLSVIALRFLPALSLKIPFNATAVYAFGDGYLDTGNNNHLPTICSANHKPYGSNFPDENPTGRFSDGELPADILTSYFNIKKFLPAFLDSGLTDEDLLTGASFASACSGIDDLTAKKWSVLTLEKQFISFQIAVERIKLKVGEETAAAILQDAAYLISGGTHDLINNFYVLPNRKLLTYSGFVRLLLANLEVHIKRIHSVGAMKIAVMGMPPVGCLPFDVTIHRREDDDEDLLRRACVDKHNEDAKDYNNQLQALLAKLQISLTGSKIAYVDVYNPIMNMVENPQNFGIEVTLEGCCGVGALEMGPFCTNLLLCKDPSNHVFWDTAYPTQATYRVITEAFLEKVLPALFS